MVSSVTDQDLTCLYLTLKIETSCKDRVSITEEHFNNMEPEGNQIYDKIK